MYGLSKGGILTVLLSSMKHYGNFQTTSGIHTSVCRFDHPEQIEPLHIHDCPFCHTRHVYLIRVSRIPLPDRKNTSLIQKLKKRSRMTRVLFCPANGNHFLTTLTLFHTSREVIGNIEIIGLKKPAKNPHTHKNLLQNSFKKERRMSQRIKNINGSSDSVCRCGSWLKHWENSTGERSGVCAEVTCGKIASEGARVQKAGNHDLSWYIIPLCAKHSALRGGEIEIVGFIPLVSADKQKTCEL